MSPKKMNPKLEERIPIFLAMMGATFHFLRLEKEVSIRQVARAIKMAPGTISDIEKGHDRGYATSLLYGHAIITEQLPESSFPVQDSPTETA